MRAADLARLNEPYPENTEPTEADARAAIGVNLQHWASLENEILADFVEEQPYGIGWWAPNPGTSLRILTADQLSCCLASVGGNITEAALHWLEYLDASDRDNARLAHAVKMLPGGPVIDPPRPCCPSEQLAPDLIRLHQAGLIRALASALDCLAWLGILKSLYLEGCTGLEQTGALAGLGQLEGLSMQHCTGLQGAAALQGLTGLRNLKWLDLTGCTSLERGAILAKIKELGLKCEVFGP